MVASDVAELLSSYYSVFAASDVLPYTIDSAASESPYDMFNYPSIVRGEAVFHAICLRAGRTQRLEKVLAKATESIVQRLA
jgi:hypothetical protein